MASFLHAVSWALVCLAVGLEGLEEVSGAALLQGCDLKATTKCNASYYSCISDGFGGVSHMSLGAGSCACVEPWKSCMHLAGGNACSNAAQLIFMAARFCTETA